MTEVPYEGDEASSERRPAARAAKDTILADEGKWARGWGLLEEPGGAPLGPWGGEVGAERWRPACLSLPPVLGHRLASYWAEEEEEALRLHALWWGKGGARGVHLRTLVSSGSPVIPSLLPEVPAALYFEREMSEMFGLTFPGGRDPRPLLLHYRHPSPPLRGQGSPPGTERAPYDFPIVEGEGVYEIPVGPVHAGIIEPGHFRFQVTGEEIHDLEVRLGYTHKGTERLWQGRAPGRGLPLAESVSGDHAVAGAVSYSMAVRSAAGASPMDARNAAAVGLLLELERMAFLLGDIAGIILDVGYAAGAAQANVLRDAAYGELEALTGSRLGRGAVGLEGLTRPLATGLAEGVGEVLREIAKGVAQLLRHVEEISSVMDRLRGTGVLSREVAEALGLVGPAARASGMDQDVRRDRPYGPYQGVEVRVAQGSAGDVEARLRVKVHEVQEAGRLAGLFLERGALEAKVPGAGFEPTSVTKGNGLGVVEAPRGEMLFAVTLRDGVVHRVHVREPSFMNWPAIEYAVRGNIVPDFPLCNKSLNLSYSGFDR